MSLSEATERPPAELLRFRFAPALPASEGANRTLLRVAAALSLLLLLFFWFDFSGIIQNMLQMDSGFLVVAIGLLSAQFALAALRWHYILRRQKLNVGWRNALSIYGSGTLANLFLVTSAAGLSVRAVLLIRRGNRVTGALASLTAERIAALAGLAICGIVGLPLALPYLKGHLTGVAFTHAGAVILAAIAAAAVAGALLHKRYAAIRDFVNGLWAAFSSGAAVVMLILASAAIVLLGFAAMAMLAGGMGLTIHPVFFVTAMPVVAFVSALPVSVGGWGVREGMMVAGLSLFTVPAESAIALSVSYGLAGLLVSATLGGLSALLGSEQTG